MFYILKFHFCENIADIGNARLLFLFYIVKRKIFWRRFLIVSSILGNLKIFNIYISLRFRRFSWICQIFILITIELQDAGLPLETIFLNLSFTIFFKTKIFHMHFGSMYKSNKLQNVFFEDSAAISGQLFQNITAVSLKD